MEKYVLDVVNKTLTITKGFADSVASGKGAEYELYTRLMHQIPGLTVVRKTHKTPTSYTSNSGEKFCCNQFKNLTYENMERFMSALPDNEDYLSEYAFIKNFASSIQTNGYALVRKWFVAQFPQFRTNPLFYLYNKPSLVKAEQMITENTTDNVA